MASDIIVALITVAGTALSAFAGVMASGSLTNYRLRQLEEKVKLHNSISERVTVLETKMDAFEERRIN